MEALQVAVPGRTLRLRGQDYVIPSIDLERGEEFEKEIDEATGPLKEGESVFRRMRIAAKVVSSAMQPNYPDIPKPRSRSCSTSTLGYRR